jgi:peptidoglycan hydrolase CwlO-like protein
MKPLLVFVTLLFVLGCQLGAQKNDPETKKDVEFDALIKNVNNNITQNSKMQQKAAKSTDSVITKAADKITSLKSEVNQLKNQLNETKAKLDSANTIDGGKPFSIKGSGG